MECTDTHYRHLLLFYFRKGKKAATAHRVICATYGTDVLTKRTCQNWFNKFRAGDFSLKDDESAGRPTELEVDQVKAIIALDRYINVRDIGEKLNLTHTTVENHLQTLGFVKNLDVWVPNELKEVYLTQRISICNMLRKRNESDPFLKQIITGEEKWIVYNSVNRKRSLTKRNESTATKSKAVVQQKKIMLSLWWDYKGILHFKVLPSEQAINSDLYCEQLMRLSEEIKTKRPKLAKCKRIVYFHDNARPQTSLLTRQKLLELDWDVMPQAPYSPDLSPSDFFLFHCLQKSLHGKNFTNVDDLESHLVRFFVDKDEKFYKRGIMELPERWQKVIEQNGQYIID